MQILQLMKYFKVYIAVSFKMSSSCVGLGKKYVGLGSEPELSDLMNEVASKVPAKWKIISIQLGLTVADQHCITALTSSDPIQCFTSVFTIWRNRATKPYTWSTIIEALKAPSVDEVRLAQEVTTNVQP